MDNRLYLLVRGVIWAVVVATLVPTTHKIFWQWINKKLKRVSPLATRRKGLLLPSLAWMIGTLPGTYFGGKTGINQPNTVLCDLGWYIVTWLGGMIGLSLAELHYLRQEQKRIL